MASAKRGHEIRMGKLSLGKKAGLNASDSHPTLLRRSSRKSLGNLNVMRYDADRKFAFDNLNTPKSKAEQGIHRPFLSKNGLGLVRTSQVRQERPLFSDSRNSDADTS